MICKKPYMAGSIPFGCGQCLPCRVNRRRQWMWRQFLESLCHDDNSFITLTYDRAGIRGDWSLDPQHLVVFIRELRRELSPIRLRYFAVGEYGEQNYRPHYHLSLFGMSPYSWCSGKPFPAVVKEIWGRGFVQVTEFNHLTAQYISGYVVKKLKDHKDGHEWNYPEFARMSNRPGIGAKAMDIVAKQLLSFYSNWEDGDVPRVLHIGKRSIPIGRYLLARLRKEVGFTDEYIKTIRDRKTFEQSVQMQVLHEAAPLGATFKAAYLKDIEGKMAQVEARAKLFKKRDKL